MASSMRFDLIPPDQIEENPENPRHEFDEQKIEELASSISHKGVLVPVTVYQKGKDQYVLLDGARRLRAAKRINLSEIPAWIAQKPDTVKNLEAMFHIHMEREEWNNADAVQALDKLIKASGVPDAAELEKMTGTPQSTIIEWKRILEQPEGYRKLIYNGTLPFNFFTELHDRVIEPLRKERPSVFQRVGDEKKITQLFVDRRKAGHLENVTGLLRHVNTMIHKARDSAPANGKSPHDKTIERVIADIEYPIDEAYEDIIGAAVETEKFVKHSQRLGERLKVLIREELSTKEKKSLLRGLRELVVIVRKAIAALR